MNIYGTIILRVYGEYTITSFLGNFGACANISYQAAFPPPPSRPGYEAKEKVDELVKLHRRERERERRERAYKG